MWFSCISSRIPEYFYLSVLIAHSDTQKCTCTTKTKYKVKTYKLMVLLPMTLYTAWLHCFFYAFEPYVVWQKIKWPFEKSRFMFFFSTSRQRRKMWKTAVVRHIICYFWFNNQKYPGKLYEQQNKNTIRLGCWTAHKWLIFDFKLASWRSRFTWYFNLFSISNKSTFFTFVRSFDKIQKKTS